MKKRIITIDIETLPCDESFESKLFWETEEEYRNTALDGNLGRILCIGYCEQNETGSIINYGCFGWQQETRTFEEDESVLLAQFWQYMKGFQKGCDLLIGHNIINFDMSFIYKRSIANDVRPSVDLSLHKYQDKPIFDTMLRWDKFTFSKNGSSSLEKVAYALGLSNPKAGEITGKNLYQAFLDERFEEIYEYCMKDVKATRNIWRKMEFTYPQKVETQTRTLALAA
jgi:DNA polymerase elongation subunit (family B)